MTDSLNLDGAEPVHWPENVFPLQNVRNWVAGALELADASVVRVLQVYAIYGDAPDLRITARFALSEATGTAKEIVYKDSRFPPLSASARIHALLSQTCPGLTPHVLAWEEDREGGSCRFIYEPFEGLPANEGGAALLAETARSLARIQNLVAASGEIAMLGLVRITEREILSIFDGVFSHIEAHFSAWQRDVDGKLSAALGFPAADVLDVLTAARSQVVHCVEQVASLDLAPTIDHGDLHGGNAVVRKEGTVCIFDWETATIGCSLFSVERLLVDAWRLDAKPESSGPWGYFSNTPTQALVREAYLHALDVKEISNRTFASAMVLATIKEMHTEIAWANRMNWQDGNPEWTAQLIRRFRQHLRDWRGEW